jgi:hypothetical protein
MIHPSASHRANIKNASSINAALIAQDYLKANRESVPKRLETIRTINGANPPTDIFVQSSGPVPVGKTFKIDRLREQIVICAPNRVLVTDLIGITIMCIDEKAMFATGLRTDGPTWDGFNIVLDRRVKENTYNLNYYIAEDSIISLVTFLDYTGGAPGPPLTRAHYRVQITGSLIDEPTNLGRGKRNPPIVNNIIDFARLEVSCRL